MYQIKLRTLKGKQESEVKLKFVCFVTAGGIGGTKWLHRMKCRFPLLLFALKLPVPSDLLRRHQKYVFLFIFGGEITSKNFSFAVCLTTDTWK